MKKHLLLSLAVSMGGFAVAQTTSAVVKPKLNPTVANQALPYVKNQQLGASAQDSFESVVNNLQRR
ncbi:MAG: hypothetical protein JNL69_02905, partial [Bacteroidia bacterium]|nr:hypothetical protein [Bacteroidia bacterium]